MFQVRYKVDGKPRQKTFDNQADAFREMHTLCSTARRNPDFKPAEIKVIEEVEIGSVEDPLKFLTDVQTSTASAFPRLASEKTMLEQVLEAKAKFPG